ncbi:MAG: hypothetical protein O3A49_05160 [Candidatus Marinimicrobia bacterium]|nr:hypothetical protein [Candidatus Neomarinimicrobiota bacterium]
MIEVLGWTVVIILLSVAIKKIFFRKKINKNELILDSKEIEHLGPLSGSFKYKK